MRLIHLAIITLTLILYIDAFGRNRPIIDDSYGFKRILTDKGSLLRGVSLAFDGGDPYVEEKHELPNKRSFKKLGEEIIYDELFLSKRGYKFNVVSKSYQ